VQGVHGPEDLSFQQVATVLTEVLRRPFRVEEVSDDDLREQLSSAGLPDGAVAGIVGMTAGTRGQPPDPTREFVTTTPTSLRSWATEALHDSVRG
jgi:uncharacterized protein YbjT (DUF2867 family)